MEQTNRLDLVMKRGKWHCHGWVAGERIRRSTGTADRLKAEETRVKWLRDGSRGVKPTTAGTTFSEAVDLYLKNRTTLSGGSRRYVEQIRDRLGDELLLDFDETTIERHREKYCDGKKALTQKRYLTQLRAVINLATERKLLSAPVKVKVPRAKKGEGRRLVYLEAHERDALIERLKFYTEELAYLIQFLCHTGARTGEALKLEWQDVDMGNRQVVLHSLKGGDGPRERTVPLNDKAMEALEWMQHRFKANGGRVFMDAKGKPYKIYVNKWGKEESGKKFKYLDKAVKDIGLTKRVTAYTMRHTFASVMRKRGVSLDRIKELMGHSSIDMTLIYAHLLVEDHRQDVNLLT